MDNRTPMDKIVEAAFERHFHNVSYNDIDYGMILYEAMDSYKKGKDIDLIMRNLIKKYSIKKGLENEGKLL